MPAPEMFEEMGRFNEELVKAGMMMAGDGLKPSRHGKRVLLAGGTRTVVTGPFGPARELVAGFWIWKVKDMDEAVAWVKRCPDPMPGEDSEIEIRPFYEIEDFGDAATPELCEQERRLRAEVDQQNAG